MFFIAHLEIKQKTLTLNNKTMNIKSLRMKRALRTALLVMLLGVAGMGKGYTQNFDFSAVCSTGQTLYYKITDATNHRVEITYPGSSTYPWSGSAHNKPVGIIILPETVQYNGSSYRVTAIGSYAFKDCGELTSVSIPNSIDSIGHNAFSYSGLKGDLIIPNSVNQIGGSVFSHCSGLTSVTISNSISTIPGYAFYQCTGLKSVSIPNSVTSIGLEAFKGCYNLTSLSLPESDLSIEGYAFEGCGITSIVIPKSVTSIGSYAFGYCSGLITAYYNAESASASPYAFYHCTNLTTLNIGPNVQSIGSVFNGCTGVHLVVSLGNTPASLSGYGFSNIADNSILMVPCGCRMAYYSVWNAFDFNSIMEDCGEYSISMNGVGTGGNVMASPTNAQMGQEVQLTVSPNTGMMLSSISVCNTTDPTQSIPVYSIGKASSKYGFVMPPFGVTVNASFMAGAPVNENNNVLVSVYPNPTIGQMKIEAEGIKTITITNLLGQTIYEGKASENEFSYNFSGQEAGVYLIRIETARGVVTKRVVVTR